MTATAIAHRPLRMGMGSLEDPEALGRVLASSGFFADTRDAAQAVVKVLAGQELGFGPIASMTGVYIVKGRVTLSANLIAAAIKRHPRYDFRVRELTNDRCEVVFYEGGEEAGTSEFTMADAQAAKLGGDNWRAYPRNMLFARALSNGAKWFCPDVFSGSPVYTPDELGVDIDPETGEVLDAGALDVAPAPMPAPKPTPPAPMPTPAPKPEPDGPNIAPPPPPATPEPEPAQTPAATSATPAMGDDPDAKLTEEQAAQVVERLHAWGTPEAMWRMALMTWDAEKVADLTVGQARELMRRAKDRYGAADAKA